MSIHLLEYNRVCVGTSTLASAVTTLVENRPQLSFYQIFKTLIQSNLQNFLEPFCGTFRLWQCTPAWSKLEVACLLWKCMMGGSWWLLDKEEVYLYILMSYWRLSHGLAEIQNLILLWTCHQISLLQQVIAEITDYRWWFTFIPPSQSVDFVKCGA